MQGIIGITGGIGSGKSIVARVLRCNGFSVYDCDSEAKRIMTKNPEVKEALIKELGAEIYLNTGEINRPLLSSHLFTDVQVRAKVNAIVHEAVKRDIKNKIERECGHLFIESAILFSSGIDKMCDKVWIVESPLEERIKRIEERDNLNNEDIKKRIKSQEREMEHLGNTDVIIIKNDGRHPVLPQIISLTGH